MPRTKLILAHTLVDKGTFLQLSSSLLLMGEEQDLSLSRLLIIKKTALPHCTQQSQMWLSKKNIVRKHRKPLQLLQDIATVANFIITISENLLFAKTIQQNYMLLLLAKKNLLVEAVIETGVVF